MKLRTALAGAAIAWGGRARAQGVVLGTVYDSLSRAPMRGAEVALDPVSGTGQAAVSGAGVPRSVTTDERGAFRFDSVAAGDYAISFSHPTLDSLGIGVSPARVRVGADTAALHLATPSLGTVARRACPAIDPTTAGVLVGRVRRADGAPAAARVTVQWSEWEAAGKGLTTRPHTVSARTMEGGAYVACGVPNDVLVDVEALGAGDSSTVEAGQVQLDLHGRVVTVQDLAIAPTTTAVASGRAARGTATLVLVVRDPDGAPVPSAHADLGGVSAVADDSGRVRLARVPSGSRVATVRALGFEPATLSLTVAGDSTQTERVTLGRSRVTQLGTVRVNARRTAELDRTGFETRRQAGFGQFVTAEQIERRQVLTISDALRTVPGLRLKPLQNGIGYIPVSTRSPRGDSCVPNVFIDRTKTLVQTSIDDIVNPHNVRGVEIYLGSGEVPGEFFDAHNPCGAIVIWTVASRP